MPIDLKCRRIGIVIGHEPGGGARGEREWNLKVARILKKKLEGRGAKVVIYQHKAKAYSKRCRDMRTALLPEDLDCILLLHYNSFSNQSANGHEFHYRGFPALAGAIRDAWQERYPWSRARQNDGILKNKAGRGSGMIKAAPAPCCLLEPFFESNEKERNLLIDDHEGVASAYLDGVGRFLKC